MFPGDLPLGASILKLIFFGSKIYPRAYLGLLALVFEL